MITSDNGVTERIDTDLHTASPIRESNGTGNFLLDGLSRQDFERISAHLKPVELQRGDFVSFAGRRVTQAYFCVNAAISVVAVLPEGQVFEGGLIGHEGFYGMPVVLGDGIAAHHAIVQAGGKAYRLAAPVLKATFDWSGTFRDLLLRYAQYFLSQVTQTAVCNRSHPMEARLARWMLMTRDAVGSDTLELTHETLAQMLGVHRPGVSLAMSALKDMSVIQATRGHVTLKNLPRLRELSCGCYRSVRLERDRLLKLQETSPK
jgi:CRP-like cAMP-binding protein